MGFCKPISEEVPLINTKTISKEELDAQRENAPKVQAVLQSRYTAVSYTHLDVYKRQPAPCFQAGEDFVPHFGNGHCIFAAAGCGCTGGYAHVR